ncbi:MAG: lipopolysaccharide assembly protein LapA domain-containing protein [Candidatus Binatia bacterium]
MIKVIKAVFLTLLFILGITFSMENTQPLVLKYYFGLQTPPVPLFLLVLFSVLLGVLLAGLGFIFDEWSLRRKITSLERELRSFREGQRGVRE